MSNSALPSTLRVVDLFSGAGGFSEGFRDAGFQIVCGIDHDPDAIATYRHNFPEAVAVWGDLRDPKIKKRVFELAAGCEVVVGGPPCQAYSQVRNHVRIIDDPRNVLYREFVEVVSDVVPVAFVMENVPGMEELGVREQVEEDLSIGGRYDVRSQVLDAADFGVPQTRKRIVFIGLRKNEGLDLPSLDGTGVSARIELERRLSCARVQYEVVDRGGALFRSSQIALEALRDPQDLRAVTVEQAIGDLRDLAAGNREDTCSYKEARKPFSAYQRRMRAHGLDTLTNVQVPRINADTAMRLAAIPQGGNYRDLPEEMRARYLTGERWGPSTESGKLERKHFYAYRKLHPDMWAWTLNTKGDSAYHYDVCRALSVREFARLQSFPDRFTFTTDERRGPLPGRIDGGPAHSRYRQVGNAVPPLLAQHIAGLVRGTLEQVADIRMSA